jgi:hypothetical protein
MKTFLSATVVAMLAGSIGNALGSVPANGTYNGLFFETNGVWQQSAGTLTLTVARGRYSGRIQIGNTRYPLSGFFDSAGTINRQVLRRFQNPLTLQLQPDSTDPDLIVGSVGDGTWIAPIYADRAVFDGKFTTSIDSGRYTVLFLGDFTGTNGPVGESFGTINVSKAGRIRFAGSLADGTKVTQAATVAKGGQWPFYLPLYQGQGAMYAWLLFNGSTNSDISDAVTWIRPQMPQAWFYPDGFAVVQTVWGSRYVAPPPGAKVLNVANARFEFNGANFGPGITNHVTLDFRNRLTNLEVNGLSASFTRADGSFRGRVMDPITFEWIPFRGVVLQGFGVGAGYFPWGDQTGEVRLLGE